MALYQCRTSPESYLIVGEPNKVPKLLRTYCPPGQALEEGTRTCAEPSTPTRKTVLYSQLFSTNEHDVYEWVEFCPEGTFQKITEIPGADDSPLGIINCTVECG